MTVVRWSPAELRSRSVALLLDELDEIDALVLDEVAPGDDLSWCRAAPCVVIASRSRGGGELPGPDLVLTGEERERLDDVLSTIEVNPQAARVLVDVLRVVPQLDVVSGLVVESLAYSMLLAGDEFRRWLLVQPQRRLREFDRPPVRVERSDRVARITLSRAENRNAFSAVMRDALHEALVAAGADPTVERIELDADGPVFSSGGDLTEFGTAADVVRAHQIRTLRSVGAQIAELAERTTVRVHGTCVGAGVELPAFAGHLVATPDTTFELPEVAMGLIPGAGGTVSISRRIGAQRTAELALSGRRMGVDEALSVGLVDAVEAPIPMA